MSFTTGCLAPRGTRTYHCCTNEGVRPPVLHALSLAVCISLSLLQKLPGSSAGWDILGRKPGRADFWTHWRASSYLALAAGRSLLSDWSCQSIPVPIRASAEEGAPLKVTPLQSSLGRGKWPPWVLSPCFPAEGTWIIYLGSSWPGASQEVGWILLRESVWVLVQFAKGRESSA